MAFQEIVEGQDESLEFAGGKECCVGSTSDYCVPAFLVIIRFFLFSFRNFPIDDFPSRKNSHGLYVVGYEDCF